MKKTIIRISIGVFVWLLAPSCKKDPEIEPRDLITSDLIWDKSDVNAQLAKQFLNSIYTFLPNGFNRLGGDFLDAASGDALPSRNNTAVEFYINGLVSPTLNPDPYWANSYAGIRQANILLANIDSVPAITPQQITTIKSYKAEARFIRAFMYFELLKRYGGVPLIGDKILTLQDNLEIPRNTFADVVNYIVSECDAMKADLLAEASITDPDLGRIPKGAAVALKCRTYLYAASPFFNGGATTSPLKTRGIIGYPVADPTRWQKVIDAAEELKALNYYTLQSSFYSVFLNRKNTEIILAKQSAVNVNLENDNAPVGYSPNGTQSLGRTSPSQNLVDAFPMRNGMQPFNADGTVNTASGYNPANPYAARDLRLGATVFYTKGNLSSDSSHWLNRAVETFEGGRDKPNNASTQTKTGYYLRKFLADNKTATSYSNQSHNFPYFRYAEILLNYAEALNEMNRVENAVDQIKLIRARVGTFAGTGTGAGRYGIATGISQAAMRDLIRNERRIELAFEEHRFWDVRRWKTAAQDLSGPVFGMKITKNGNVYTYEKVQAGNMVFNEKLYLMPIPYEETLKNSVLEQNPGW
jgi:hypothetical protein